MKCPPEIVHFTEVCMGLIEVLIKRESPLLNYLLIYLGSMSLSFFYKTNLFFLLFKYSLFQ